jgi:hypothetical protein
MSEFGRRFVPDEIADGERSSGDVVGMVATARALEALADTADVHPSAAFADRVMGAVQSEPAPQPARAFGAAVLTRRPLAVLAAVRDGWRVIGGLGRPIGSRAQGVALAVVSLLVVGSIGALGAGAAGLFRSDQAPAPSPIVAPSVGPSPSPSMPSPSPSESPSVAPSPAESDDSDETNEPAASPTDLETEPPGATDDHGGNSGPGGGSGSGSGPGDSGSGSGSSSGPGSDDSGSDDGSPDDSGGHSASGG